MTAHDEFSFIEAIRRRAQVSPAVRLGIGDDAAWLAPSTAGQLVAVDMLAEGRHFTFPEATPELVGRKALAVNLSDLAAMGGRPTSAFVSLLLPRVRGSEFAERVMAGLLDLADSAQVTVAGGDTNSWDGPLVISVTVCGEPIGPEPILRSGAQPDDWLMVSGPLGGSLPSGRHLTFEPRLDLAEFLVEQTQVHAMIDLSDGLASDLRHILAASGVGAELEADAIPIHADVDLSLPPDERLQHALGDGEDFELLIAVSPTDGQRLLASAKAPFARIGRVTAEREVVLIDSAGQKQNLPSGGWIHRWEADDS